MKFKTIVTLGPSILDRQKLKQIDKEGNCVYRINGAHANPEEASRLISYVRSVLPKREIFMDLPGNKIRTTNFSEPIRLIKGERFILHDYQLNYPFFYKHLKKGDIVLANDSTFTFKVIKIKTSSIELLSYSEGLLLSNKGLHVRGIHKEIPFLFEKDYELINLAKNFGVKYISLSFVRTVKDIEQIEKLFQGHPVHIIAKIETLQSVKNLRSILRKVESILIDRGDLSTEMGLIKLASVQEQIIDLALRNKKRVYLATQFLKNMETKPVPLISEIVDLCKTIKTGIAGIQLSEETAIGKYPVECVKLVFDAFKNSVIDKKGVKAL